MARKNRLAAKLGAACRLLKDVRGFFDSDPASDTEARRFVALSWPTTIALAVPLIQAKALRYAQIKELAFEVADPMKAAAPWSAIRMTLGRLPSRCDFIINPTDIHPVSLDR
jgi:uridylate kinase